ncbi:MAG: hypothetical protein Q9227_009125 [Pyrenula ochraceoflavens]
MLLRLPTTLHYPITVTKILKESGDDVALNEALFVYTYRTKVIQSDRDGNEKEVIKMLPSKFESQAEGTLKYWSILEKDVIKEPGEVCEIEEPCKHSVQFDKLCAICGKDMTELASYNSDSIPAERALIQMDHTTQQLRVSKEEASRVEEATKKRLLAAQKLSLVVDLDMTIIHATVDSTIAEWQEDENNPNYEAVKDVAKFQLEEAGAMRATWYYIKLRPGLEQFLETISEMYELHIYTMGTRQYAQQIARIVDPDRKFFADRILSRDESGSMTAKSLQRLFPGDQTMVVIIDDRGDVWKWSDNLIKVHPFDFFIGIGDINSSFLPKREEIPPPIPDSSESQDKIESTKPSKESQPSAVSVPPSAKTNGESKSEGQATPVPQNALDTLVGMSSGTDSEALKVQSDKQRETIAEQVETKPLMQMQKRIDEEDEAAAADGSPGTRSKTPTVNGDATEPSTQNDSESVDSDESTSSKPPQRHALLHNDDRELISLCQHLTSVHSAFYTKYDLQRRSSKGGRVGNLLGKRKQPLPSSSQSESDTSPSDLHLAPDIRSVMPAMKHKVLEGVTIVFSGVIPLLMDVQSAEISLWAKSFGATVSTKIGRDTTHVVTARPGTAKVKQAVRRGNKIKIVTVQWLQTCLSRWEKVREDPYLVDTSGLRVGPRRETKDKLSQSPKAEDHKKDREAEPFFLSDDESDPPLTDNDGDATTDTDAADPESRPRKRPRNGDYTPSTNSFDEVAMAEEQTDADMDGSEPIDEPILYTRDASKQAEMDAEFAEFMGSDLDDSESETDLESVASGASLKRESFRDRDAAGETGLRNVMGSDDPDDAGGGESDDDSLVEEDVLAAMEAAENEAD